MKNRWWIGMIAGAVMYFVLVQNPLGQVQPKVAFLTTGQIDAAAVLANPPSNESKALAAELAELHRLQDSRSPVQIERAKHDDAEEDIFIFKDVLGEKFDREALPLTALLSDHVHNTEGIVVNPAKAFSIGRAPIASTPHYSQCAS